MLTCPWLSLGGSAVVILPGHLLPKALRALFLSVQYSRNSAYLQQHINETKVFLQPFTVPVAVGRGIRNPVQFAEICVFMQQNHFFFIIWLFSFPFPKLFLLLRHFSRVQLCATPWTAAYQASRSMGFSRQEHWSGLPFPSPMRESGKWKWSRSVVSDS